MSVESVTALSIVNRVLTRLREDTVENISDTAYATMIFGFLNDAKREVEDAFNWDSLLVTLDIPTVASQQYVSVKDTTLGIYTNARSRVIEVYDTDSICFLVKHTREYIRQNTFTLDTPGQPFYWAMGGMDETQNVQIEFFQIPDGVYNLKVTVYNPSDDFTSDEDYLKIPWMPVFLRTLAMAIQEKGEDGGATASDITSQYVRALGDAIAYEQRSKYEGTTDGDWYVP